MIEEPKKEILESNVEMTEIDQTIYKNFDFNFDGKTTFEVPNMPDVDRICYSHEYIGPDNKSYDPQWNKQEFIQNDLFGEQT